MAKLTNEQVRRVFDAAAPEFDQLSNPYIVHRRAVSLAHEVQGRSVEFGGGTGAVTHALPDRRQAMHTDIAPNMCRVARGKLGCPSICCDAEAVPFADESVDTAISSEMLYYLDHPELFIAEARRVLRTGGRLLICTPNPLTRIFDHTRSLLRRLGFKHMFFDDGSPPFIRYGRLTNMLLEGGFAVESTKRIVVLPFACCDRVNRFLENTIFRYLALFMIVVARKRNETTGAALKMP